MVGYIYRILSPTGKTYVGKTFWLSQRMDAYKHLRCEGQKILYASLVKYGWKNHKFEILEKGELTNDELSILEMLYILKENSFARWSNSGMNLTLGGDGCSLLSHSEETKRKISLTKKNSPKTEAQKSANLRMFGRKIDKSEEWKRNNGEGIKKPILQLTLDGKLIDEWKSAKDVQDQLGLCRKNISANLRKRTQSAYGYKWIYKGQYGL